MPFIRRSHLLPVLSLAAALGAAAVSVAADAAAALPSEVYLLPRDSAVVFAADVRGFFASRLWAQVGTGELGAAAGLDAEKAAEMARQARDEFTRGMAEMEAEMGFRADRDVDWIVFAVRESAPPPKAVAVFSGRFDAARVLSAAEAAQAKGGRTVSKKHVGRVTVLSSRKGDEDGFALAVADPGHFVIGDEPLVEAVLADLEAGRRPLQSNQDLAPRLSAFKPGGGVYLLAGTALMRTAEQRGTPPFPLPRSIALSVSFETGGELVGEMASPEDAQRAATTLQSQIDTFKALLAQETTDPQKALAAHMISGLAVAAEGTALRLSGAPGVFDVGVVAAIAIPSMLRARVSANEAAAIGDVRSVISAQAAYQAAGGGFYGDIGCLPAPSSCLKGYAGGRFLDPEMAALEVKGGYKRAFHPGPRGARARTLRSFAYTAVPVEPGRTGVRSFCGDSSGAVRFDPRGADIQPVGGVCPATLEPMN